MAATRKKGGLGKGLDSLIPSFDLEEDKEKTDGDSDHYGCRCINDADFSYPGQSGRGICRLSVNSNG